MNEINYGIPDAINVSPQSDFTQIPNIIIRNPNLSFKAKGLLALLLSNKEGWKSYIETIKQMSKDNESAIRTGIAELEANGYLLRLRYRDQSTKQIKGSIWAYTNTANHFELEKTFHILEEKHYELVTITRKKPKVGFLHEEKLHVEKPYVENPLLKRTSFKKTNEKNTNSTSLSASEDNKITASLFDKFWELYPGRGSKGDAKTKWITICNRPPKEKPTWPQIKKAILSQKKSEQWQDPKFIPHASTWLNKRKWMDDPKELIKYDRKKDASKSKVITGFMNDEEPNYSS